MRHGTHRAVAGMTIGHIRALEKRRRMLGFDELGEIENQFQIPISGVANTGTAWASMVLTFDVGFVMAPEQRDSPLTMPHMTYGAYLSLVDAGSGDDPDLGVEVFANVRSWVTDDPGSVVGARVAIGVRGDAEYRGFVHLTFQGYGAPLEDNPDLDVGT